MYITFWKENSKDSKLSYNKQIPSKIANTHNILFDKMSSLLKLSNPVNANATKWWNTLKQLFDSVWPFCGVGT